MRFFSSHPLRRRLAHSAIVFVFIFTMYGTLLIPQRASAQFVPTFVEDVLYNTADWLARTEENLKKRTEETVLKIAKQSLVQSVATVVQNFSLRLSTSVAKSLAEGGKGGKPLFDSRQFQDAVKEAGEAAVGDVLDEIGKGIGFNLCQPPELNLNIGLQLFSLIDQPKQPTCKLNELKDKWKKFGNQFDDPNFLQGFLTIDPKESETGIALSTLLKVEVEQNKKEEEARLDYRINKGFKGVEKGVSAFISLPAAFIQKQFEESFTERKPNRTAFQQTGDYITDLFKLTAYNFTSTFVNAALTRLLQEGLFKQSPPREKRTPAFLTQGSGATSSTATKASSAVQQSFTANFGQTGGEFDLLSELSSCPDASGSAGTRTSLYQCAFDQNFVDAVRQGMSVKEAITAGKLRGDWPFGFQGAGASQSIRFDQGYGYENMKKLRRARIIPIGWELAAEMIRDTSSLSGATLQRVVDDFDTEKSPFYRLVDPNWVLKAPLYSCRAKAPSQLLLPGTGNRLEYCVDLQDCVVPTEDGNGCKAWGYCTRESNVWRFDGRSCAPQFNTCTTYTRVSDGASFAYNRNTRDSCTADGIGCRWYSTNKTGDTWSAAKSDRLFFNRNAASCTPAAAGCSQFTQLSHTSDQTPFAVADYRDTLASVTAQDSTRLYENIFDVTAKQLYLKGTRIDCRANTAIGEQEDANVGCELYRPSNGDPGVPAVLAEGDRCPNSCVGYDAYKESATAFSPERFPLHFIPRTARACSAEAVACDEFTNLDAAQKGGEARAYYNYLRQCQKPAGDSKTYFTWTGSETSGYQLETHLLKASNLDNGKAPCTSRRLAGDASGENVCTDSFVPETRALCTKDDLAANPDCREFYDVQGNISYRLMSRTIISDEGCVRYRRTPSDDVSSIEGFTIARTSCLTTGGAWNDTARDCTYLAFPPESRSCSAEAVGCREYKGNTANDVRTVVRETFESIARPAAWSAGLLSTVSITSGGHSLEVNGATTLTLDAGAVANLRTYLLSFWARGTGNLTVTFAPSGGSAVATKSFALSPKWLTYTMGPLFTATWPVNTQGTLTFSASNLFLDTVHFKEVRDQFYLVKNSWKTPAACQPNGDVAVMAGCREYRDRKNVPHTLTSFGRLCEERFVGCSALIDTKNSTSPRSASFNTTKGSAVDDVTVSADTLAYVVNDPAKYCAVTEKGCSALGDPPSVTTATSFAGDKTKFLKNDPDIYSRILCTEPDLSCEAYTRSGGGEDYFKDPGDDRACVWRQVPETTNQEFGWFKKNSTSLTPDCQESPSVFDPNGADSIIDKVRYTRECPASEDLCTAFIDPVDTADAKAKEGKSYYVIDDESLQAKRGSCNGAVSIKEGCALFRNANKLDKDVVEVKYNAKATYDDSEKEKPIFKAVAPVTCKAGEVGCDANDILKVRRDRTCGEWLACISGTQVFDRATQKMKNICYAVGSCTEASSYNASECSAMTVNDNPDLLTRVLYAKRDISWKGQEYAGYSIPYQYPVTNFVQLSYQTEFKLSNFVKVPGSSCVKDSTCGEGPNYKCIFGGTTLADAAKGVCFEDKGVGTTPGGVPFSAISKSCRAYPSVDSPFPSTVVAQWTPIQFENVCYSVDAVTNKKVFIDQASCFQIAQGESVGSLTVACAGKGGTACGSLDFDPEFDKPKQKQVGFEQANVAQKGHDAECSYARVRYADGETRFWNVSAYPTSVGASAANDIRQEYGWKGYCLEEDASLSINGDSQQRPCLTWFPTDIVQGEVDVNTSSPEAGYQVKSDRRYYCVETRVEEQLPAAASMVLPCKLAFEVTCRDGYEHFFDGNRCPGTSRHGDQGIGCKAKAGVTEPWAPDDGNGDSTHPGNYGSPALPYQEKYRVVCSKLALVESSGTSLPWTDRLRTPNPQTYQWSDSAIYSVSNVGYKFATDPAPYGAVAATITPRGEKGGLCAEQPNDKSCGVIVINENNIAKSYAKPLTTTDTAPPETSAVGIARLNEIFARVYGVWEQKTTNGLFMQVPIEITHDTAATKRSGPLVRAAKYNSQTQTYIEGGDGITVENASSGTLEYRGTTARAVALKFYAYNANGQQMPLRRIMVDWNDGEGNGSNLSVSTGAFKNHKNKCNRFCQDGKTQCVKNTDCGVDSAGVSNKCLVANFGDTVEACVQDAIDGTSGYFVYTHVYRCDVPRIADDGTLLTSAGWDPGRLGCIFRPKVQVLDNWGWCNSNASGVSFYNDPDPKGLAACDTDVNAWMPFRGEIVIQP